MSKIGSFIKEQREVQNISIEVLHIVSGLPMNRIERIESGEGRPSLNELKRIAYGLPHVSLVQMASLAGVQLYHDGRSKNNKKVILNEHNR